MSATSVSARSDLAAVGPITGEDVFLIATVIPPDNPKLANYRRNGYTFALLCAQLNDNGFPQFSYFTEAAWGSLLSTGEMPEFQGRKLVLPFFRYTTVVSPSPTSYDTGVSYRRFYPFYKPDAVLADVFVNQNSNPLTLGWAQDGSNFDLRFLATTNPQVVPFVPSTTAPVNVPENDTLQAGIRYQLDQQDSRATAPGSGSQRNVRSINYLPVDTFVTDVSSPYQGLPLGIQGTILQYRLEEVDFVFLPMKWFTNQCQSSVQVAITLQQGYFHFCDRWSKYAGSSSPFYQSECLNKIDAARGNTNAAICQLTDGFMYYPATTGTTCGSSWRIGTTYSDMTDTLVTATISRGPCGDGVCAFNATAGIQNFVCLSTQNQEGTTCTPDCTQCATDCSDCGTERCANVKVDCDDPTCKPQTSSTACNKTNKVPVWIWVIMGVLLAIIVILIIVHLTIKPKPKDDFSNLDEGEEDIDV